MISLKIPRRVPRGSSLGRLVAEAMGEAKKVAGPVALVVLAGEDEMNVEVRYVQIQEQPEKFHVDPVALAQLLAKALRGVAYDGQVVSLTVVVQ